ncbi:MAG TPA: plastocyanin/azurin family copper-binding protein [Solirubrobacteraceae bacterium]|nr:plastocyanin/azurin family copper-binding protein [Solirubrobacteraceae bacterium]
MRRFVVVALAPVLVIVAAGCGSSSSSSGSSTSASAGAAAAPSAQSIAVAETEYRLTPANPSVKSGAVTITARNNGKVTHAIEVAGGGPGGKDAKSASISPGASTTLAVDLKPGKTYTWYCPIDGHRGLGMQGQITVAGSSGSSSSGSTQTSTSGGSGAGSKGAY